MLQPKAASARCSHTETVQVRAQKIPVRLAICMLAKSLRSLRDALVGSLLFLSVVPILSPAVGFPGLCTPTCLILIKQAPEGKHGCVERVETVVGRVWGEGVGRSTVDGGRRHISPLFLRHLLSLNLDRHSYRYQPLSW